MIRSRDLVIFVVVVLFLCVGILLTHLKATYFPLFLGSPIVFSQDPNATTTFTAVSNTAEVDREANIDRLKKALALGGEILSVSPSVEDDSVEIPQGSNETDSLVVESGTTVISCGEGDDVLALMPLWPRSGVSIALKDGMRVIVHTEEIELPSVVATTSSSTTTLVQKEVVPKTLLTMAMYPKVQATSSCVPSTIIGITSQGSLLSNSDASFYTNTASDVLIGYARDGFPVYGVYGGEVDTCGGYMHPEGYRYTISKDRNFILGCFVGVPSSFNL